MSKLKLRANDFPEFPVIEGLGSTWLEVIIEMRHRLRELVNVANMDESEEVADAAQVALKAVRKLEDAVGQTVFAGVGLDWSPEETF